MRGRIVFSVMLMISCFQLHSQDFSALDAMLLFSGISSAEELSEEEAERLEELIGHPLQINMLSQARLEESGLLTHYQVVSLTDYRERHGDVLSFSELAAVDGFGEEFVRRIRPFISLESSYLPGQSPHPARSVHNDLAIRTDLRTGSSMPSYALKYRMDAGGRLCCGLAVSRSNAASDMKPDAVSGFVSWHFRKLPGKVALGDFNARFGQGLALWNGMGISALSSPSSFLKRSSGLSLTSSFTGKYSFKGVGADLSFGPVRITSMVAMNGTDKNGLSFLPAVNVLWYGSVGSLGLTHYSHFAHAGGNLRIPDMKTSLDAAFCIRGTDVYAETSFDWVTRALAVLAGASFRAGEDFRLASMVRYYPSAYSCAWSAAARSTTKCTNEYALSVSGELSSGQWISVDNGGNMASNVRRVNGTLSLDAACFPEPKSEEERSVQIKALTDWKIMLSDRFRLDLRVSERIRSWGDPFHTELRSELTFMMSPWLMNMRLDAVKCDGWGLLGYWESGFRNDRLSLYFRLGLFAIDDWDDRIYVYERNAPGTFSVPAYYGRGVWAAFTGGWKYARWGKAYLRAAMTTFPFMKQKKSGKAELKLQFVFDF